MNEIGIDSLSLAEYMPLTQAMVDQIAFMIQKSGVSSGGPQDIGSAAYFEQTISTYDYFEQNVQLMQQNNKPIGAYFFSFAWDYASAYYEAELECRSLRQLQYKPDWPVFIDWEAVSRDAVTAHGYQITTQRLLDIVHGWSAGCSVNGFYPGFYTSAAIARDDFGNAAIQQLRSEGIYFWEAHYDVQQPWVMPCDIWQYDAGPNHTGAPWMGTVVDWNKIMDDRIWSLSGKKIPVWLLLKLTERSDKNGCAILL